MVYLPTFRNSLDFSGKGRYIYYIYTYTIYGSYGTAETGRYKSQISPSVKINVFSDFGFLKFFNCVFSNLEVKDYGNNGPQFWMIQIPYQKNNLSGTPLFFLVDWGTSRVFYHKHPWIFTAPCCTSDTPSGRCWSCLEHEGHSAEEWKGLGVF